MKLGDTLMEEKDFVINLHHLSPDVERTENDEILCPHCSKPIAFLFRMIEGDEDSIFANFGKNVEEIKEYVKKEEETI